MSMAEVYTDDVGTQKLVSGKKKRKRRHSLSSLRTLSTVTQQQPKHETTTNKSSTLTRTNRFSTGGQEPAPSATKSHKGGASFFKIFKSKPLKSRLIQSDDTDDLYIEKPILLENKSDYIRVVTTELNPRIQYKTLPITEYTTAYEIVVKIVRKFAAEEEDKDPHDYYLTEEQESEQGNYSRILENNDRLHAIQSRWTDTSKNYSFVLCRKQRPLFDESFVAPISAVVLSPSQDSFYNCLPGMITVEVGATPPSQTEHLMNTYLQPHSFLTNHRQAGAVRTRLSTNGRVGTDISGAHANGKVERQPNQDRVGNDVPHSTLPVSPSEMSTCSVSDAQVSPKESRLLLVRPTIKVEGEFEAKSEIDNSQDSTQLPLPQVQEDSCNNGIREGKSGSASREGEVGGRGVDYKKLMQQSISQGMPGIMNQVTKESKHNDIASTPEMVSRLQIRRASVPANPDKPALLVPQAQLKPVYYSPGVGQRRERRGKKRGGGESIILRTLVCSPMETASRKFPEFVFTPGPSSESRTIGSGSIEECKNCEVNGLEIVPSKKNPTPVTEDENEVNSRNFKGEVKPFDAMKCDTKSNCLARQLECDFNYNEAKVERSIYQSKDRLQNRIDNNHVDEKIIISQVTFGHHQTTSKSVLAVTCETCLTVPYNYHSRASLYATFLRSAYYSTEMDIMESLHTLLDIKFKHAQKRSAPSEKIHNQKRRPSSASELRRSNIFVPSTECLMHEARKSRLICSCDPPAKKTNTLLKRPSSFHFQRTTADNSSESSYSSLDSPVRRELLMKRAAEAVKQRGVRNTTRDSSLSETESNDSVMLHVCGQKPTTSKMEYASENIIVKSMENLTSTSNQLQATPYTLSSVSQNKLSSSISSLQTQPSRHVSCKDDYSRSVKLNYNANAAPRRVRSFHESSQCSQSLEALHFRSVLDSEEGDEELLYTLQRRRPVTVLVRSNSSLAVNHDQRGKKMQSIRANNLSSNLTLVKSVSSQGIVEAVKKSKDSSFVATRSQKRFSLNRPTSAPTSRSTTGRGEYGLDGLLSSINLKADKLWWNEL